uniref:Uncharacterized protein n=1 Tax=viral metagenome TaxID=1070528 RepID=A0A6C0E8T5_9ZZZZ
MSSTKRLQEGVITITPDDILAIGNSPHWNQLVELFRIYPRVRLMRRNAMYAINSLNDFYIKMNYHLISTIPELVRNVKELSVYHEEIWKKFQSPQTETDTGMTYVDVINMTIAYVLSGTPLNSQVIEKLLGTEKSAQYMRLVRIFAYHNKSVMKSFNYFQSELGKSLKYSVPDALEKSFPDYLSDPTIVECLLHVPDEIVQTVIDISTMCDIQKYITDPNPVELERELENILDTLKSKTSEVCERMSILLTDMRTIFDQCDAKMKTMKATFTRISIHLNRFIGSIVVKKILSSELPIEIDTKKLRWFNVACWLESLLYKYMKVGHISDSIQLILKVVNYHVMIEFGKR